MCSCGEQFLCTFLCYTHKKKMPSYQQANKRWLIKDYMCSLKIPRMYIQARKKRRGKSNKLSIQLVYIHGYFVVCLLFLRRSIPRCMLVRVEWSAAFCCVEIEAYNDQAAVASNLFCCKYREEPSKKPSDRQHRVVQLTRSDLRSLDF